MHIRKTNSAGCDLEKKLALPKRRPGNLLHAEFVISRNQRLHHPWLVTGHVSLITSSNAFTKQAPSSREREQAFLHLCWSCVQANCWASQFQCSVSQQTINNRLGLLLKGSEEFLIPCLSVVTALVCLESLLLILN